MFERFIQERLYLQNVSPRTVEWYRESFKWLGIENPTEAELKSFVIRMREKGLCASSCNNRIRAVKAYLKWQKSNFSLAYLREEQKILPTYSPEHLKRLIDFKPKTFSEARLHTIFLTLVDCGCRVDEVLKLRWSDCDFENMLLVVLGKGNKERKVPFSFELRKALWRYRQKNSFDLVFPTQNGGRQNRHNVLRDFKLLCKRLGIPLLPRSIHALRHTFAVNYLRQGGSVFHLQKALGHSSLEMSRRYANLLTEDLQAIHQKVSVLNRMR